MMYQHILISTDGSVVAQKGVDHGLSLAKALDAQVTLITITEGPPVYAGLEGALAGARHDVFRADQKEAAENVLATAKQAAERIGVTAETVLVGDAIPFEAIIATAKARGSNLIVMASHGRRGLGRLVLGSVTSEVVAHSPVPVLVVR